MFQLVYVSSATRDFSSADLIALLEKSRENNRKSGISGMLLYKDGGFMQVLEGEEPDVLAVHARIIQDPRHRGIIDLIRGPIEARSFPDWSMGFRDLKSAEALATPGYSEFLNTPLTGREFASQPARCQKLLLTFKRNR